MTAQAIVQTGELEADMVQAQGQEGQQEEKIAPTNQRAWYVVHCYSGYENKVKKNLESRIQSMGMQEQIFQVVVPTEEEVELRSGQRRITDRRIFPGYVLVEMRMNEDSWYVVRNTPGVTGFVGSGTQPTPLREDEVKKILKRMEAGAPKVRAGFREGQNVRIIDGPFSDFMGTVDHIDAERGKVRVLVSFFGRETPIELDLLQVEKV
jgi:transcriptional antiterminator NusG